MKNIFLYQLTEPCVPMKEKPRGIYNLDCNLIGIDTQMLDKQTRNLWITKMNLREFHVLQRWFANFIYFSNRVGITILSFKFADDIDEGDQREIDKFIFDKKYEELIDWVSKVAEDNETDIERISFSYKKCLFDIYSTGVLNISGACVKDIDSVCLSDTTFLSLLSGNEYGVKNSYENY